MARVEVQLPSVFTPIVAGRLTFSLEAESLRGAWQALRRERPEVGLHLFDESGALRRHVLCFHNDRNSRWLDGEDAPLRDGDTLLFMQAVSGG
ncbi:MAG: MoaD/ThiS family protein [Phycisphaerales bacterium]|nr:MoaD/ThiS family protein [Phycisphaerales bacterium]